MSNRQYEPFEEDDEKSTLRSLVESIDLIQLAADFFSGVASFVSEIFFSDYS
jgi:hypothetical protein